MNHLQTDEETPASRQASFIPAFSGDSYLELPTLRHVGKDFHIEVWFLTHKLDGLLIYNGQQTNGHGDFISLNLAGGRLEFRFDLGGGATSLTSADPVTLNEWHIARLSRRGRQGSLQLDDGRAWIGEF